MMTIFLRFSFSLLFIHNSNQINARHCKSSVQNDWLSFVGVSPWGSSAYTHEKVDKYIKCTKHLFEIASRIYVLNFTFMCNFAEGYEIE